MLDDQDRTPGAEPNSYIFPAEHFGIARTVAGMLNVGGVQVPLDQSRIDVFVRRDSEDLTVVEIHLVTHDGLMQEELDHQNEMAEIYPLGAKEYWRAASVGKCFCGPDDHPMTDEEFEREWEDGN